MIHRQGSIRSRDNADVREPSDRNFKIKKKEEKGLLRGFTFINKGKIKSLRKVCTIFQILQICQL